MPTTTDKRRSFRALHRTGCFVLPNPWDVGTARYLQYLGFQAIATTSSGAAFSIGLPDGAVHLDTVLDHIRTIVEASDLPVNADFQAGYAADAEQLGANVRRCVETGVAGLSIEDATGDPARPFYPREVAARRIAAARAAIDAAGGDVILVGRAEWKIASHGDLDEVIGRLRAYADAGADCLYAPGLATREQITAAVAAVAPKPLNILVSKAGGLTVAEIAALGVRRVSLGSALARTAWGAFIRAASTIASQGRFDGLADAAQFPELNAFFQDDAKRRRPS
jgi:2-methylisocitrate lyase-like PEP mutase family enzyme